MQEFIPIQRLKKILQKNVKPKTRREDDGDSELRKSGRLKWAALRTSDKNQRGHIEETIL